MEFKIKLCGIVINICHRYGFIRSLCEEYAATDGENAAFSVTATNEEIDAEKGICTQSYPNGVYEATCIHRNIVCNLVKYGIILMHSAVVAVDGRAYVFMAKSGVGKTTHIRLWCEAFGDRAVVVNGDKPFFSFAGDTFTVHGSPWKGKEGLGVLTALPVEGICFLERGEVNSIAPATEAEVVDRLFHQVLLPKATADQNTFIKILNRVLEAVPFYRLKCNTDKAAAIVAYEGMRKDKGNEN